MAERGYSPGYPAPPGQLSQRPVPPPPPAHARYNPRPNGTQPRSASTFYVSGSAAPPIVAMNRRPPASPNYRSPPQQSPPSWGPPPLPNRAQASPIPPFATARARGVCNCCSSNVEYTTAPLHPRFYQCRTCGMVTDPPVASEGGVPSLPPPAPGFTMEEIQLIRTQLEDTRSAPRPAEDPELRLIRRIREVFLSTRSLDLSCLGPGKSLHSLPVLDTIRQLYDLILSRRAAVDVLREVVEALLGRPGPHLREGRGGWACILLECPIFQPAYTPNPVQRTELVSRAVGLMSNLPDHFHAALVRQLTRPSYHEFLLQQKVDLVVACISMRISDSLASSSTPALISHWSIKPCARIGALLFAANQQLPRIPFSNFYVPLLDTLGGVAIVQSFDLWAGRSQQFSMCQYPFLLSLGIKMHLLAYDGARQMEQKAREAFRSSVYTNTLVHPFLVLKIRRSNLIADSLREISSNRAELKKSLRVVFEGEEGVDAGGVRKEWFLALCRQLFDPKFGMFVFSEETGLCYFNPAALETPDEFFLVGVICGLAIYNAVTLDVPLPLVVYKKVTGENVGLADLKAFNPALAQGLQALLDFDGDVAGVFCRSFVGDFEAWGEVQEVELVPGGADITVDASNREEFVQLYVEFLLNISVSRQFESFAAGFKEVAWGNAFSLVKGEEIELLVRGSTEPLDVDSLKGVTVYEGFTGEDDPTIRLFWSTFVAMSEVTQRKLLSFVTGSDRIPAIGTSALQLKITCMGDDTRRYPTSHTCFNQLVLPRYRDRDTMESRLMTAMDESEGFGLK